MANQEKIIRRRKGTIREAIPDGEVRNVTFRVGSRAYNMLIKAATESGKSVSEMGELLIDQALGDKAHERRKVEAQTRHLKSVSDEDLSAESKRVVETIANVLVAYDKDGGWSGNDLHKIGARFAIQSVCLHAMGIPSEAEEGVYSDQPSPEKSAADKGIHLGSIYWDPVEFVAKTGTIRDVLSHPSMKEGYGHLLKEK